MSKVLSPMQLSIIIPVYNVAKFLPKCLDSVLSKVEDDWEVIVVDDGSTDDSPDVIREYAAKYRCIKTARRPNGGLSAARNTGTALATGKWIYFLDSDDYIEPGSLQQMVAFAEANGCDIVQGGLVYEYPDCTLPDQSDEITKQTSAILDRQQAMEQLVINCGLKNFAWGKLYRRSLIADLPFPKGKYFEDSYWQHLVIDRADKVGILRIPHYHYLQRTDSISGMRSTRALHLIEGNEQRYHFIRQHYPQHSALMALQLWHSARVQIAASKKHARTYTEFKNRYNQLMQQYGSEWDMLLRDNVEYRLARKSEFLATCYNLLQRIKARICDV